MTTIHVHQAGQLAAICTPEAVHLVGAVAGMPDEHPDKIRVACKAMIAGAILNGHVPGPYLDSEAEAAADLLISSPELLDG